MATLTQLVGIQNDHDFQGRVAGALAVAAAAVYSEASVVATSAATAAGSKVLTFSAVPAWVTAGPTATVVDLTTAGVIPAGSVVVATTSTTVTLSDAITGTGVVSGDDISFTQHAARARFADQVGAGNYNILAICWAVLGNSAIAAEANPATTPDFAIPDADIQFAVNSLWNELADA